MSGSRAGLGPSVLGFAGGPGWTVLLHMGTHKTALGTPTQSQLQVGVHRGMEHLHPDDLVYLRSEASARPSLPSTTLVTAAVPSGSEGREARVLSLLAFLGGFRP